MTPPEGLATSQEDIMDPEKDTGPAIDVSGVEDDLPEGVLEKIRKANSENRNLRARLRASEEKNTDLEASLESVTTEQNTDLQARVAQADEQVLRLRVALRKGLTETQAKRLVGSTEEEIEADADDLLQSFGGSGTKPDDGEDGQEPPRRQPRAKFSPGDPEPQASPDLTTDQALSRIRRPSQSLSL